MSDVVRDLVVIGGGPSALTAALYAGRDKLDVILYEKGVIGGMMATIDLIKNYPGFSEGVSGLDLAEQFEKQARDVGVVIEQEEVKSIEDKGNYKIVVAGDKSVKTRAVLLATGRQYGGVGTKNEEKYIGRGIHYCATCDGRFYNGKNLVVIGGANSAIQEAIYLTRFATHIDLLVRSTIKASRVLVDEIESLVKEGKVAIHLGAVTKDFIITDDRVSGVITEQNGKNISYEVDGVFIFTGMRPNSDFVCGAGITVSDEGFIVTNDKLETNVKGIFACGDVRDTSVKQIVTAAGEGAEAALSIREYLGIGK